jgi:hypothetical protein
VGTRGVGGRFARPYGGGGQSMLLLWYLCDTNGNGAIVSLPINSIDYRPSKIMFHNLLILFIR